MGKKFTISIIGCGSRGREAYGDNFYKLSDKFEIVSICDIDLKKVEKCKNSWVLKEENCFLDVDEFFKEKRSDALVIATQDRDHVWMCIKALELGYDVLLEKPITPVEEELYALLDAQKKYGGKVVVCHVLRYAPAYLKIKEVLDSGEVGKIVCIDWMEQVGYWHQAHSFVRGNWRDSEQTSPMIMAKCCHDLDLLQYYVDSSCKTVYSVGSLAFFKKENQPEGASDRCSDCKYKHECVYSAERLYVDRRRKDFDRITPISEEDDKRRQQGWPFNVVDQTVPITDESIRSAYENSNYGQCVFACDNNVVDNQKVLMTFENGVTVNLTMTGFSTFSSRQMTFHCTLGDIEMDEQKDYIRISRFGKGTEILSLTEILSGVLKGTFGHGGGDVMLVKDFYNALSGKKLETSLDRSVESHLMALSAEKSRKTGKICQVHEK